MQPCKQNVVVACLIRTRNDSLEPENIGGSRDGRAEALRYR